MIWLSDPFSVRGNCPLLHPSCFQILSSIEDSYIILQRDPGFPLLQLFYFVLFILLCFILFYLRGGHVENQTYNLTNNSIPCLIFGSFFFHFGKTYCGNKCFCQVSVI